MKSGISQRESDGSRAVNDAVSRSSTCAGDANANRKMEITCVEAENSFTLTSQIESKISESPPISHIERSGSDLDSVKGVQGQCEGTDPSTTTGVAATGSAGAEEKDISGCTTD